MDTNGHLLSLPLCPYDVHIPHCQWDHRMIAVDSKLFVMDLAKINNYVNVTQHNILWTMCIIIGIHNDTAKASYYISEFN